MLLSGISYIILHIPLIVLTISVCGNDENMKSLVQCLRYHADDPVAKGTRPIQR